MTCSAAGTIRTIDTERLLESFTPDRRMLVAELTAEITRKHAGELNYEFFGNLRDYHSIQRSAEDDIRMGDLFVPNLAVLDYSIEDIPDRMSILSCGCGLGACEAYLSDRHDVYLFDDWSQVPRHVVEEFQSAIGSNAKIVDDPMDDPFNAVMSIGARMDISGFIGDSVTVIMADAHYDQWLLPAGCPVGFAMTDAYPSLLNVYRRKA